MVKMVVGSGNCLIKEVHSDLPLVMQSGHQSSHQKSGGNFYGHLNECLFKPMLIWDDCVIGCFLFDFVTD